MRKVKFKSHLYGIEIFSSTSWSKYRCRLNRTFMELKCFKHTLKLSRRRFKSHLYGIEITNTAPVLSTSVEFKSNLYGIEIQT